MVLVVGMNVGLFSLVGKSGVFMPHPLQEYFVSGTNSFLFLRVSGICN